MFGILLARNEAGEILEMNQVLRLRFLITALLATFIVAVGAACTTEVEVVKEVVKEVPVEVIKEVEIEKIIEKEGAVRTVVEEVIKEVEIEKIVEKLEIVVATPGPVEFYVETLDPNHKRG